MQQLQPNTTLQGGKYRIERVLGQGGFGITYLARNTVFDIDVAIKEFFMKDENERDGSSVTMPNSTKTELFIGQKEKFKKEAKRMFAIKNEHIIGVHDLFEENGTAYYVMDYVDGENLAERLKRTGKPLSEQEVREILPQILDALKSVHEAGIWHLDLKPANIMVDKFGNVKLIDFGASKQLNAQKGGATTSTAISYTNGYAPREQMEQNYDKFGPWTDIYALGATLYNLLTNKRPPLPTDIDDDVTADKHEALPFPSSTSIEMKHLVLQMMQTNRLQRPQRTEDISVLSVKRDTKNTITDESPKISISDIALDEETIIAHEEELIVQHQDTHKKETEESSISSEGERLSVLPRTDFITAIKYGLYEKFSYDLGRSRRSEFWWFVIFYVVASIIISFLSQFFVLFGLVDAYLFGALAFAFTRRLHDSGHSGYWCWLVLGSLLSIPLSFIPDIQRWILFVPPLISFITIIYLGFLDSEVGENEYGEPTKYVYVDSNEEIDELDNNSWIDSLSAFLSNGKNVIIVIVAVLCIFLSYILFGSNRDNNNIQNSTNSAEYSSTNYESVDLGLSVDWATVNVGAKEPNEIGNYYWWASTDPIKNETDAQNVYDVDETGQSYKKYNSLGMTIASEDDVARKTWGGVWRTPTPDELYELVTECTWEEAEYMDAKGYNVKGKNGNKIFLPYVFNPDGEHLIGSYMSNTMSSNSVDYYYNLYFADKPLSEENKEKMCVMEVVRKLMAVVRPVKEKK